MTPDDPCKPPTWMLYAAVAIAGAVIVWHQIKPARSQDCEVGSFGCGHGAQHDQYKQWNTPQGWSCCSDQDCRPVRAYQGLDGGWFIYIPEFRKWKSVPTDRVSEPDRFKDGRSHACTGDPVQWGFDQLPVYCFSPAQQKS